MATPTPGASEEVVGPGRLSIAEPGPRRAVSG